MKNKQYDLEFWRKPGETDAETRERVYRDCKTAKMFYGFDTLIESFDAAVNAFWECVSNTFLFFLCLIGSFLAAPYHIGRAIILRYLILLRIGAITWYGKHIEN